MYGVSYATVQRWKKEGKVGKVTGGAIFKKPPRLDPERLDAFLESNPGFTNVEYAKHLGVGLTTFKEAKKKVMERRKSRGEKPPEGATY